MDKYLKHDNVIDYDNAAVTELAGTLFKKANNELDFIKTAYEFVRDHISHSADINEDSIIQVVDLKDIVERIYRTIIINQGGCHGDSL